MFISLNPLLSSQSTYCSALLNPLRESGLVTFLTALAGLLHALKSRFNLIFRLLFVFWLISETFDYWFSLYFFRFTSYTSFAIPVLSGLRSSFFMPTAQNSLSESQITTLFHHFELLCAQSCDGLRNYLLISFFTHAGLRLSECLQLTWDLVMLEGSPLESVNVVSQISKNGVARSVPMCKALRGSLLQYHLTAPQVNGFIFPSKVNSHSHLCPRTVQKFLEKESLICLGIPVHPHQLRHTFATRMMRLTNLRNVQMLLGHASIKSTQFYTHPDIDDLKAATSCLDKLNKKL